MDKKYLKKTQDLINLNTNILNEMKANLLQKYPPCLHIVNEQGKIILESKITKQEDRIGLLKSIKEILINNNEDK
mgnify:CR=1 FL=1